MNDEYLVYHCPWVKVCPIGSLLELLVEPLAHRRCIIVCHAKISDVIGKIPPVAELWEIPVFQVPKMLQQSCRQPANNIWWMSLYETMRTCLKLQHLPLN